MVVVVKWQQSANPLSVFGDVGFSEGGKPEYPGETLRAKREPTTLGRNQTWAILMGGECSHHCTNFACLIHVHTDQFFSGRFWWKHYKFILFVEPCNFNFTWIWLCEVWVMSEIIITTLNTLWKKKELLIDKQLEFLPVETLIEYG